MRETGISGNRTPDRENGGGTILEKEEANMLPFMYITGVNPAGV